MVCSNTTRGRPLFGRSGLVKIWRKVDYDAADPDECLEAPIPEDIEINKLPRAKIQQASKQAQALRSYGESVLSTKRIPPSGASPEPSDESPVEAPIAVSSEFRPSLPEFKTLCERQVPSVGISHSGPRIMLQDGSILRGQQAGTSSAMAFREVQHGSHEQQSRPRSRSVLPAVRDASGVEDSRGMPNAFKSSIEKIRKKHQDGIGAVAGGYMDPGISPTAGGGRMMNPLDNARAFAWKRPPNHKNIAGLTSVQNPVRANLPYAGHFWYSV